MALPADSDVGVRLSAAKAANPLPAPPVTEPADRSPDMADPFHHTERLAKSVRTRGVYTPSDLRKRAGSDVEAEPIREFP